MKADVTLVIGTEDATVLESINTALQCHREKRPEQCPVSIVTHVPNHRNRNDLRSILKEARRRAEISRQHVCADAGVGVANGSARLLCLGKARWAQLNIVAAVAVSESGVLTYAVAPTYPRELQEDLEREAEQAFAYGDYDTGCPHDVIIPAGIATAVFTRLVIETAECTFELLN